MVTVLYVNKESPYQMVQIHRLIWSLNVPMCPLLSVTSMLYSSKLKILKHSIEQPGRSSRSCCQFSLPASSLSRNLAICIALECNPGRLGHSQSQTSSPMSATEWQGNFQIDLQCQGSRHCHHKVQWATCAAWHWRPGPHPEGEKAPLYGQYYNDAVRSACDKQVGGKRGPGRPKMTMEAADRERSQSVEAFDPHDRHTSRSGVRSAMCAASQLPGRGAHWCSCCPCTCMLITRGPSWP